ncbi:hypothetical protein GC167_08850 [bacterium]|nr:hypothetical protein [bacterium]
MSTVRNLCGVLLMGSLALTAHAQDIPVITHDNVPYIDALHLSGPRVGVSYFGRAVTLTEDRFALDSGTVINPFVTQFGWQFEWMYFQTDNGSAGLFEFIPLLGGMDQGLLLPSANLLVGFRSYKGWEFGCGPNLSLAGNGFVLAAGYTFRSGYMNFPVNFAVVPGPQDTRVTMLVGWNKRSR